MRRRFRASAAHAFLIRGAVTFPLFFCSCPSIRLMMSRGRHCMRGRGGGVRCSGRGPCTTCDGPGWVGGACRGGGAGSGCSRGSRSCSSASGFRARGTARGPMSTAARIALRPRGGDSVRGLYTVTDQCQTQNAHSLLI